MNNNGNYSTVTTSFTKLIQDLFLTFIMIFDIPLCNRQKVHYIFFFVCEYPHRNQTFLLNIYLKSNNMKKVSPNIQGGCFHNFRHIIIVTSYGPCTINVSHLKVAALRKQRQEKAAKSDGNEGPYFRNLTVCHEFYNFSVLSQFRAKVIFYALTYTQISRWM